MIVRDLGDCWQVVLQTDHGETCGAFARAWVDRGPLHSSLELAAERHDDGWAVWEQSPLVDATGMPVPFLSVQVPAHLTFYRACISSVSDEDPYAGLLVSMHGAGIYRQRYGRDPGLKLENAEEVQDLVEAFVAEQEATHAGRASQAGVDDDLRWADYERLQLYDRLCLYFCMRDVEAGEAAEIGGYALEPIEPWHVRMSPFPFGESPAAFSLKRRLIPKRAWTQAEFRRDFWDMEPASMTIHISG
ncbi:MAG: DUF3891 family protein [Gaiella sp.]